MQIFKLPTAGTFANFEIHFLTKSASSQSFCIIHIYLFLTFSLRSVTHTPQQPDSTALQFQRVHTLLHRWWPGLVLTHEQVNICLARLIFFFKRQLLFFCLASHRLPHFTFKPGLQTRFPLHLWCLFHPLIGAFTDTGCVYILPNTHVF